VDKEVGRTVADNHTAEVEANKVVAAAMDNNNNNHTKVSKVATRDSFILSCGVERGRGRRNMISRYPIRRESLRLVSPGSGFWDAQRSFSLSPSSNIRW